MTKQQLDEVADMLGLKTDMAKEALAIACENLKTFDRKQEDYGSGNISAFGERGVLVRCQDKLSRLRNLIWDANKKPNNEPVEDAWLDLANYGLIGALCHLGRWR